MMLEPRDAARPWQRMMLILENQEIRLENELGETLASASDLPALLDAVEGGVADTPVSKIRFSNNSSALAGFIL